jgi:hypothetical protein
MPEATDVKTIEVGRVSTGGATRGTQGGRKNFNSWDEDRDGLIQFLEDLKTLLDFLINNRVPPEPRKLFLETFPEVQGHIDDVIGQIRKTSDGDATHKKLVERGLTGKSLKLKLRELYHRVTDSPAEAVVHMADVILGSLFPVFLALEPVKEFKETLEARLKHGGDSGIISLNLGGNEKWWEKE